MYLDDGVSRIDFILAWEVPEKKDEQDEDEIKAKKARKTFEANLEKEGLKLEQDLVRLKLEIHMLSEEFKFDFLDVHCVMKVVGRANSQWMRRASCITLARTTSFIKPWASKSLNFNSYTLFLDHACVKLVLVKFHCKLLKYVAKLSS